MTRNLFSIPIFFIVFRETLEAAIIVSVLLGLAKQIVHDSNSPSIASTDGKEKPDQPVLEDGPDQRQRLLRKVRIQIIAGACTGLIIAFGIGAAFIAVWFTKASNLWEKSESLWEAIFSMIASVVIFVMGVTMLRMDRAKVKWRTRLERAFDGQKVDRGVRTGKWVFFLLPFVTVLREGLEAVVFVGGVSLGQPATSIPIATIVGILCGLGCGFVIYQFASRTTLTIFLVVMTNLILLIGSGLFARAIGGFQTHAFQVLLGASSDDARGTGPGSYDVRGNVWHLDCCSPENKKIANGWTIFTAVFGWSNNATIGTVLGYVFYWLAVIVALVYLKFTEGRTKLFGLRSVAARRRQATELATSSPSAGSDQKVQREEEIQ